jgi:precorrin-8X/cobalt-precorrin-8 methylmutase
MRDRIKIFKPNEIEAKSFEIISGELKEHNFDKYEEKVVKRIIHTTADFEYLDNVEFCNNALKSGFEAIKNGCNIVTDTRMVFSGINKRVVKKFGGEVICFIDDENVVNKSKETELTRSYLAMEEASKNEKNMIFVIGNAPTALIAIYDLIKSNKLKPELVIGMPVGFVNVVEAKELIKLLDVPYIVARGRKGGSNVAAATLNAILYILDSKRGA